MSSPWPSRLRRAAAARGVDVSIFAVAVLIFVAAAGSGWRRGRLHRCCVARTEIELGPPWGSPSCSLTANLPTTGKISPALNPCKKAVPCQPSPGGCRTHKKSATWPSWPVFRRPGRPWGLIGRTAAPDTRFWTRSTAIRPLIYRTSARSYRRCLVMTAATAKNRGQNGPQRTPKPCRLRGYTAVQSVDRTAKEKSCAVDPTEVSTAGHALQQPPRSYKSVRLPWIGLIFMCKAS